MSNKEPDLTKEITRSLGAEEPRPSRSDVQAQLTEIRELLALSIEQAGIRDIAMDRMTALVNLALRVGLLSASEAVSEDQELLTTLSFELDTAIQDRDLARRERDLMEKLVYLEAAKNRTDARTGLATAKTFDEYLPIQISTEHRHRYLIVVAIDLEGFREVNNQLGHDAGNLILEAYAKEFQATLREGDELPYPWSRTGGDEFMAALLVDNVEQIPGLVQRSDASLSNLDYSRIDPRITWRINSDMAAVAYRLGDPREPLDSKQVAEEITKKADARCMARKAARKAGEPLPEILVFVRVKDDALKEFEPRLR